MKKNDQTKSNSGISNTNMSFEGQNHNYQNKNCSETVSYIIYFL